MGALFIFPLEGVNIITAKNIKGIAVELGGETTGLGKALADVEKKSRDLQGELKQVERLLKMDPGNVELVAQKQKLLQDAVANTKEKLERLKTAQSQVSAQFEKGDINEEQYRAFQREVVKAGQELQRLEDRLKASDKALTSFADSMKVSGEKLQDVGGKMKNVGENMTTYITAPIIGAGVAAEKFSMDFNKAMGNVASLIPGNTERVKELKKSVQDLAVDMGTTTGDVAGGLYQVESAFGDTAETVGILTGNVKLARAGLSTTSEAIGLTSAVTKGYGDATAEAVGHASDLAVMTVRLGQTTLPELANSIGRVVPLAAQLKVSQEELFAVMATASGVTGDAAEVSTQFRGVLQALMAPTKDMAALLKEKGYASGEALIADVGLAEALKLITEQAQRTNTPLQEYIGSIEGQTVALALAGPQAQAYLDKLAQMQEASGATAEAFKEQTEGINKAGFEWEQTKAKLEVMAQTIGDDLAPAISEIMDSAGPLIEGVTAIANAFASLPEGMQATIIGIVGLVVAIGPVLVAIGALIEAVGTIGIAFGAASVAVAEAGGIMAFTLGIISSPITAIIVAVGALIAVGALLAKAWKEDWGGIQEKTAAVGETLMDIFKFAGIEISAAFAGIKLAAYEAIYHIMQLLEPLAHLAGAIVPELSKGFDELKEVVGGKIDDLKGQFKDLGQEVVATGKDFISVGDTAGRALGKAKEPVNTVKEGVSGISSAFRTATADAAGFGQTVEQVGQQAQATNKELQELADAVADALKVMYERQEKAELTSLEKRNRTESDAHDKRVRRLKEREDTEKSALDKRVEHERAASDKVLRILEDEEQTRLDGIEERISAEEKASEATIRALENIRDDRSDELDDSIEKARDASDATIRLLENERDVALKAIDERTEAERNASAKRLDLYEEEYQAKLKNLDLDLNSATGDLRDRIDAIKAEQAVEDKALAEQHYQKQLYDAQEAVSKARTADERLRASARLNELMAEHERKERKAAREAQIEALNEEIEDLREQTDQKKDLLKEEYDTKKEHERDLLKTTLDRLKSEQEDIRRHYNNLLEAERARVKERLRILEDEKRQSKSNIDAQIQAERNRVKEHVEEMQKERTQVQRHYDDLKLKEKDRVKTVLDSLKEQETALTTRYKTLNQAENDRYKAVQRSLDDQKAAVQRHYQELKTEDALQGKARKMILEGNQKELIALLDTYTPLWRTRGKAFGEAFNGGLASTQGQTKTLASQIGSSVDATKVQLEGINGTANIVAQGVTMACHTINKQLNDVAGGAAAARQAMERLSAAIEQNKQKWQNVFPITGGSTYMLNPLATYMPKYAKGGIAWDHQVAEIAEDEPEAIIPLSKLGQMTAGGDTYNFILQGPLNVKNERDAEAIGRGLFKEAQRKKRSAGITGGGL